MEGDAGSFSAGQVAVLADIARGMPLPQALDSIVRLIEGQATGMLCSVLLLDAEHGVLRHGAAPNLPADYVRALEGSKIGPEAGSCGTAAYRQDRVIVEDIARHPYWTRYRHLALPHGLLACWSTPIFSPERTVLGTFAMYYRERRGPSAEEATWVNVAVHLASIAIASAQVEQRLRRSEAQARQLARLYAVASSVSETLVRGRDPVAMYASACRTAVENGLAVLAWIGVYHEDEDRVEPVSRFGRDDGYIDAILLRARDDRFNRGPAARALSSGTVEVSTDIADDPTFFWKDEALRRGLRSCAVFPFRLGGRRRAIFVIYRETPDTFVDEVKVLGALAGNIAFAIESGETEIERRRLFTAVTERVKELTLLHRASRVLQAERPVDHALLADLVALIPPGFLHPELCEARIRWAGLDAHTAGWRDSPHRLEVALTAGSDPPTTGAIEVIYREPTPPEANGPFLTEELDVLSSLADLLASHFGRALAEQALREREERLRLLHELGEAMRGANDAGQVLAIAVHMLGSHLRVSRCGYAEIGPDGDQFTVVPGYTAENSSPLVGHHRMSDYGPRFAAAMRRGGAPVVVRDVERELAAAGAPRGFRPLQSKAFICCTLIRGGAPRAMMAVQQDEPRNWTAGEIRTVEEVVERCWAMIEQRTAETKLSRNEAMLRIAGQAARLGGWSVELPGRRVIWSDEVCAMHGLPAGATPSLREATELYTPEYRGLVRASIDACTRDGTPFDHELELVTTGDRRRWVRAIGNADRGPSGAITRIHGACQDISERRRLEDQLRQAQKMEAVGLLASGVAHDFNNVLSVILSYSSFLVDSLQPSDPIRPDIEEIQKAGERAGQLTRQLLAFSRQQILQPRVIALDHITFGLETMLRRLVGETVALSIRSRPGNIVADPSQIEQVLVNLVVNARDAMPAGGALVIETASVELDDSYAAGHPGVVPGPYVLLAVTDSGVGMDAATRSRIFEPFFTTKEKGKGTGLGLATVYGVVKQSGGHIWVDSEPGRGTAFKLYFPRSSAAIDVELIGEKPVVARGSETILLVEDDGQVRKIAGSILRRAGYFVFEAPNAADALAASERYTEPIHLLVTDVIMPRMGGRDLAERLAVARPELRVLYISGYPQESVAQDGVLPPDAPFLGKPLTPDSLTLRVREVLDAPAVARPEQLPAIAVSRRPTRRSVPPAGNGRHILHLDDEEALVHLTARILTRLGYRVSSFTDPARALQSFREQPAAFDAVVTDVSMHGMTGFELVREVWTTRADIPVVVTSGDFRPEDILIAEAMRIRDLVVKPDTVEELGRVLHELFTRPAS